MKSKTSFFNKAIFKKNMTLYWPIWACYLLYGLLKLPGSLWSGFRMTSASESSRLAYLASGVDLEMDFYVAAFAAVITGMALFGYLFTAKSANMIHALPVTRTQLYVTNVISGLTFLLVPQILVFFLSVIVCLYNGVTSVQYLALWLFSVMGASFFFYGGVCFCAMLTGLVFALPVYFVVLNYLSIGLERGMRYVLSFFGYGISYTNAEAIPFLHVLSPLDYISTNVYFQAKYTTNAKGRDFLTSIAYSGGKVLFGYVAAAVVFYLLAMYCYHRRGMEHTGDLLIFGWIKPVFRWGAGIGVGYFSGIFVAEFLDVVAVGISKPVLCLFILIMGMLGFFIADMFVQKSFRVFDVRRWKEGGMFALCLSISFVVFSGIGYREQQYIPDEEQVEYAYIEMNYPAEFTGENVSRVINIHREILEHKNEFQELCKGQQSSNFVRLVYCMADGDLIERQYQIPSGVEASSSLAEEIFGLESETTNFMRYMVGYDYDQITRMEDAKLECLSENGNYVTYTLSTECAKNLYRAIEMDAEDGTVQKYNLENYLEDTSGTSFQYPCAYLTIFLRHPTKNWQDCFQRFREKTKTDLHSEFEEENFLSASIYLKFGEDCTNIIKALIEEGVIKNEDDLIYMENGGEMG